MEVKDMKKNAAKIILACSLFLVPFSFLVAAPAPVPKEALKALQIAKGKPCRTGVVFMDGKYIAPPYVVKRYGTAIMINDIQVTAPLVAWEEFMKTQSGVQVTRTETPPEALPEPVEDEPEIEEESDDDPLADLFDDDPKPAKKKTAARKKRVRKPPKPTVTTTYAMEGDFVMNDAAKALVEKINRYRTDVNARLLEGGFIFFGSNYSRVSGERREAKRLLAALPGMMRTSKDGAQLLSDARRNNFQYLTEPIANDLIRNRYTYPQLEARSRQLSEDEKIDAIRRGSF